MDLKELIEKVMDKVKEDDSFKEEFLKDPEKAIEKVTGIDIPDGMFDKVIEGVKEKILGGDSDSSDNANKLSGILGGLKKLF